MTNGTGYNNYPHDNNSSIGLDNCFRLTLGVAIAYSAKIETVREEVFVFLSVTILILIGGVTLIKMILNFWL